MLDEKDKSYSELMQELFAIPRLRDKVFLKLTYACAARVGEIVRHYEDTEINPPITTENIRIDEKNELVWATLITEKTHKKREVCISSVYEPWLTEDILNYCDKRKKVIGKEKVILFDYSTRWAGKVFAKWFPNHGQHIHLLRGWRINHFLDGYATNGERPPPDAATDYGGWQKYSTLLEFYKARGMQKHLYLYRQEETHKQKVLRELQQVRELWTNEIK